MSKYRTIRTKTWDDAYFRGLDRDGKLLFLYLLTNQCTDICGVYEIAMDRFMYDTGFTAAEIESYLLQFRDDSKVAYQNGWIAIKNFIKNQASNPSVMQGIAKALTLVPEWAQKFVAGEDVEFEERPVTVTAEAPPNTDVRTVFTHWQTAHSKTATKLDSNRETKIKARLKDYSVEQLCAAIDGALKDDWFMGRDPKTAGKQYNDIATLLKNNAQVDRFLAAKPVGQAASGKTYKPLPEIDWDALKLRDGGTFDHPTL